MHQQDDTEPQCLTVSAQRKPDGLVLRWSACSKIRSAIKRAHAKKRIPGPKPSFEVWNWRTQQFLSKGGADISELTSGQTILVRVKHVTKIPNLEQYFREATPAHVHRPSASTGGLARYYIGEPRSSPNKRPRGDVNEPDAPAPKRRAPPDPKGKAAAHRDIEVISVSSDDWSEEDSDLEWMS